MPAYAFWPISIGCCARRRRRAHRYQPMGIRMSIPAWRQWPGQLSPSPVPAPTTNGRHPMSAELPLNIRDWPPAVPLWPAIAAVLPIGRPRAYQMAAAGELPFVRRLGTRHVIITSLLKAYLGLGPEGE